NAFGEGIVRLTRSIDAHEARHVTSGEAGAASARAAVESEPPALGGTSRPSSVLQASSSSASSAWSAPAPRRLVPERLKVALSFSGAEREFVRAIAEALEHRLGSASVFFDEWYEFYVGGHDADVKLQRIYSAGCELAVVCVSANYGSTAWPSAE